MKILILIILCIINLIKIQGQTTLSPQLISSCGESFSTPSVQMNYSIGEPVAASYSTGAVQITQGFQRGQITTVLAFQAIDLQAIRLTNDSVQLTINLNKTLTFANVIVQKSLDALTFSDLKNKQNITKSEQVMDFNDAPIPTYYRLKIKDAAGQTTYSKVRVVAAATMDFQLTPNPVNDVLTIILDKRVLSNALTNDKNTIQILDSQGRLVKTVSFSKITETLNVLVADLPTGVYFCRLNTIPTALKFIKVG
jgi:hypothetical protein